MMVCRASHGKLGVDGVRSAGVGHADGETFHVCPGKEERGRPSCLKGRAELCVGRQVSQNPGLRSCCLTDTGHGEAFMSREDERTWGRTVRE